MGHLIWLSCLLILTPPALGYVVIDRDYLAALIRDYIAKRCCIMNVVDCVSLQKVVTKEFRTQLLRHIPGMFARRCVK